VHDFKTPINSIEGMLDLIIKGHLSAKEAEELANKMQHYVAQSKVSIDQLIVWLKSQMGAISTTKTQIDLKRMFEKVKTYHMRLSEQKNLSININLTSTISFYSDKELLFIILNNLISNAIKFSPRNGSIDLHGTMKADKNLLITVADHGKGMCHKQIEAILDTSDHAPTASAFSETGTGLGLIICKELIEKLSGSIKIESEENQGVKISIILPTT
ncbi:HAMP domain-containing histidine kinase, partial [Fulvivirga sp. RKSG066]|uniref:sensor histidine kinase n=1 Tax=Fulvivirga aurantia TaxID=2529383 RepID=UPI0012BB794A